MESIIKGFLLFSILYVFVFPQNFGPSGEKKMLGLQANNSSNDGRCDGIISVWEAGERAQRDFFPISGVI